MNESTIKAAQDIKNKYQAGELTSVQYFARLASLGKKYNISVWEIQKTLATQLQLSI